MASSRLPPTSKWQAVGPRDAGEVQGRGPRFRGRESVVPSHPLHDTTLRPSAHNFSRYLSQFQDYAAQIEQAEEVGFKHPLSWFISGRNATFMVVEMVVFMLFLLLVEYAVDGRLDIGGRLRKLFGLKKSSSSKFTEEGGEPFEEDVAREAYVPLCARRCKTFPAAAWDAYDPPLHR